MAAIAGVALRHASVRSVWMINSLRGAIALAAAVAVADLTQRPARLLGGARHAVGAAHATPSRPARPRCARSSGRRSGSSSAAPLLVAIGASSAGLWVVLPVAVFVAAYAPGTAPFAVGQAAFTVTVAVLFNLLVPAGWKVGVVRIEDVAIGCAVSVVVGLLFWPRGLASVVGDDLADAYRAGARYLEQARPWVAGVQDECPTAAARRSTAATRLDEALRGFLAEQGTKRIELQELWRLVGGATAPAPDRLRRSRAWRADGTLVGPARRRDASDAPTLAAWFDRLWRACVGRRAGPPTADARGRPTFGPDEVVHDASGSHYGVWLCEHLDHLAEHLAELVAPAAHVAEAGAAPGGAEAGRWPRRGPAVAHAARHHRARSALSLSSGPGGGSSRYCG